MSIVFYHDDIQKKEAMKTKKRFEDMRGRTLYTEITQFKNFYMAEEYHQKYYLQRVPELYRELRSKYNNFNEFVSSTLVARVNGYIAGNIEISSLIDELGRLQISQKDYTDLINLIRN